MNCCAGCFGDRGLRKEIIPARSTEIGLCTYCNEENVAVLAPSRLAEYFELLISAYHAVAGGQLLVQWFRKDWGMFDHPRMDDDRATALLAEILEDGDIVRRTFAPAKDFTTDRLNEWEKLRDELMYQNRFFPQENIDLERLGFLLNLLTPDADEVPGLWYRARIQTRGEPYSTDDMGAPPKRTASHGRANPAGIPYLYLGSSQLTSISEIRPHAGEMACVADFRMLTKLGLVDLRNPKKMISPFLLEDAADVVRMRCDVPFLERLGDELTRPVVPQVAAIEYAPSQYLCEFIKRCGYKGVIYGSSVSNGVNLALFDPALAEIGTVLQYRVARVSVEVEIAQA